MAKTPKIKTTLAEALNVQSVWQTIPDLKMGTISLADFTAALAAADALAKQHAGNAVERAGLKANRDDKTLQLGELVSRFRSTVRGMYGPDSPLYQQSGGTRSSARKSAKRPVGAPLTTTPASTTPAPTTPAAARPAPAGATNTPPPPAAAPSAAAATPHA